jgi:D-glycero-alpha-D-manno-heptose 1-phosphate guanylyltransferase
MKDPMSMHNTPDVIVLCGGAGRRLRSITGETPKPMAPVSGRPFLELLLTQLNRHGFRRVILAVGFNAERIKLHFGTTFSNIELLYSDELTPLGTGGALRNAARLVMSGSVLIANGDSYTDANLITFVDEFYLSGADVSLVVVPADGRIDCGAVVVSESGTVLDFSEKCCLTTSRYISAGIYMMSRQALYDIPEALPMSLEQELLPLWLQKGMRVRASVHVAKCMDIGTPDRYRIAQDVLKNIEISDAKSGEKGSTHEGAHNRSGRFYRYHPD